MNLRDKVKTFWRERASIATILQHNKASFSQFGEDVVLQILMQPGREGTYVDVGANHPADGSNTFRLYLRGWSGLAIDPNPRFAKEFEKFRPRDCYLTEGVSLEPATLTYHSFESDVFNTFDANAVNKLLSQGHRVLSRTPVGCRPLAEIVDQHLHGRHIDVLNVDCEGLDVDVLDSLDLTKRRPTAIIVEDYPRYITFQRDLPAMRLQQFLRDHGYLPLAQMAWSGIYVAEDWRDLFKLSNAFDEKRVQNGYLPGQTSLAQTDL